MNKRIHIIIADSSTVIQHGIISILQQSSNINADITSISDVTTISSTYYKQIPDLIIINPSQLGAFSPMQLKNDIGNERLKIIALQSSFTDQSTLQNYDEILSIFDSSETIIDKIKLTLKENNELDIKKELSAREKEIIVCVVKGMTNKLIADTLFLSTHTVIAHRRNIANKLQIHTSAGLTIYAIVNKLVNLADVKNSITKKEYD